MGIDFMDGTGQDRQHSSLRGFAVPRHLVKIHKEKLGRRLTRRNSISAWYADKGRNSSFEGETGQRE